MFELFTSVFWIQERYGLSPLLWEFHVWRHARENNKRQRSKHATEDSAYAKDGCRLGSCQATIRRKRSWLAIAGMLEQSSKHEHEINQTRKDGIPKRVHGSPWNSLNWLIHHCDSSHHSLQHGFASQLMMNTSFSDHPASHSFSSS